MILRFQKNMKKVYLIMAVFIVLFSLNTASFAVGNCEMAYYLCWVEHWWEGFEGAIYCTIGYMFCKKYIDSINP